MTGSVSAPRAFGDYLASSDFFFFSLIYRTCQAPSFDHRAPKNTRLEGARRKKEEKRGGDNEPASVTAMGNQELTLLIIKAWQARRRRGGERESR